MPTRRCLLAASTLLALPTVTSAAPATNTPPPAWSRQAVIYQVNVRQYSAAGTLRAVQADLPRLKALGVDILWLMPVQPIGQLHRKGRLGSYYSISDYTAVNPEFGTLADAKALVAAAQQRRVDDEQADRRARIHGRPQGGVVGDAQVPAEPDERRPGAHPVRPPSSSLVRR